MSEVMPFVCEWVLREVPPVEGSEVLAHGLWQGGHAPTPPFSLSFCCSRKVYVSNTNSWIFLYFELAADFSVVQRWVGEDGVTIAVVGADQFTIPRISVIMCR